MEFKLTRKLVVSVTGVVVAVGLSVALYVLYGADYVKQWREVRTELRKREQRLGELRKEFAYVRDPKDELKVLRQEVKSLVEANQALQKVKTAGYETSDLPDALEDPEPEIRKELYKEYMKPVMEISEDNIKNKLREARISPPEIDLYTELSNADEAAYYMNRAAGVQGIIDALTRAKPSGSTLVLDKVGFEDYDAGNKRREGAVNVMSYDLQMTMDTATLMSFLYHLREEDNYYFIERMQIIPRRGLGGSQSLNIAARINTTMVFESQVKTQVRQAIAGASKPEGKRGGGGWMADLARAMAQEREEALRAGEEKKWWEFWKWFE